MKKITSNNKVVSTGQYRMCLNLQIFEILSTLNGISATVVDKKFLSGPKYTISSVDGNTYPITLFTNKLWDLILLKLTEVVHCEDLGSNKFHWGARTEWKIYLSIHTIADCMGLSDEASALTHLYDRVVTAANVLQNIRITVDKVEDRHTKKYSILGTWDIPAAERTIKIGSNLTIDGYLDLVLVRDNSDADDYITKSNALFCFRINPVLIEYIDTQKPGLYHFDHCWLYMEHSQNAYVAAKVLGRHYSQNTHTSERIMGRKIFGKFSVRVGVLRNCLPSLNSKIETDNRSSLDNALKSIPGAEYAYVKGGEELTFEGLTKLKLRKHNYNQLGVIIKFYGHPNTSDNEVTTWLIRRMYDDALYKNYLFYELEAAEEVIDHRGRLKQSEKRNEVLLSEKENNTLKIDSNPTVSENDDCTSNGNGCQWNETTEP